MGPGFVCAPRGPATRRGGRSLFLSSMPRASQARRARPPGRRGALCLPVWATQRPGEAVASRAPVPPGRGEQGKRNEAGRRWERRKRAVTSHPPGPHARSGRVLSLNPGRARRDHHTRRVRGRVCVHENRRSAGRSAVFAPRRIARCPPLPQGRTPSPGFLPHSHAHQLAFLGKHDHLDRFLSRGRDRRGRGRECMAGRERRGKKKTDPHASTRGPRWCGRQPPRPRFSAPRPPLSTRGRATAPHATRTRGHASLPRARAGGHARAPRPGRPQKSPCAGPRPQRRAASGRKKGEKNSSCLSLHPSLTSVNRSNMARQARPPRPRRAGAAARRPASGAARAGRSRDARAGAGAERLDDARLPPPRTAARPSDTEPVSSIVERVDVWWVWCVGCVVCVGGRARR